MMRAVRVVVLVIAVLAIAVGLLWVGQGSGYFPYPQSSFMIDQTEWIYRGGAVAALGLLVAVATRWMR